MQGRRAPLTACGHFGIVAAGPLITSLPLVPPLDSETNRWFNQEVLPHENLLRAYLRRKFPALTDVDDVVQESYLKVVRARLEGRLESARGFLFTVARNIALDGFRRRGKFATTDLVTVDESRVLEEKPGVAESVCRNQELALLIDAIESLPLRCRQVLKLRKIYGLSHKEIAAQLGIAERTVNVQVGLGVRRCAEYLEAKGVTVGGKSASREET